ncbi:MAG: ABC transporter permease [Gemmatimonadetes bacterium]|nr:ABC transporter permease [Gemmatimonadota bacterium]
MGERVYRVLLRLYPRRFKERFGVDLLEVFRGQRAETRYAGLAGGIRFWWDLGWDWAQSMVAARRVGGTRPNAHGPEYTWGGWMTMDGVKQDLGFAVRSLMRSPGFTVVAVATLAIGIGSNAAMFSVVEGVLLEPLPYGQPDRVVTVWSRWRDTDQSWVSNAEYRTYLTQSRSLEDLAIWNETDVTFTDPENPERVAAVSASSNLLDVLGVSVARGRFFTADEAMHADTASSNVIVISHAAWQRRWAGDPSIVGQRTEVNGRLREVLGVLPEGFRLPTEFGSVDRIDVYFPRWIPRTVVTAYPEMGGSHYSFVVGRLGPGATPEVARRELGEVIGRVHTTSGSYPAEFGFEPLVLSVADDVFGTVRPALLALFATVGLVLLIACANVANLMLARSEERERELAVRAALGAGRRRLVGQLCVESVVLAGVGGAAGLGLAMLGVDALQTMVSDALPRVEEVALDGSVLAFTLLVTLATALAFGVWPALRATATGLAIGSGTRSFGGRRQSRWQAALVSAQTALALVLVVGAGLMARTLEGLTSIEPGFHDNGALTVGVSLPTNRYPDAEASSAFWRDAIRQIGEIPGVRSATAIRSLPLTGTMGDWGLDLEGYDETVNPRASGDWQIAAPGYFGAMGIPVMDGRDLTWSDDTSAPMAVVVNETLAARYWPGQDAVGRWIRVGDGPWGSVIGVVGDVRHEGLTEEVLPKFYVSLNQWSLATGGNPTALRLVVVGEGRPSDLVEPVRDVVRRLDPSLAVAEVRSVGEILDASVAQPRLMAVLMGLFGLIALTLALVGVYGVVAYAVGRRRREIGVRMALGAVQDQVVGLMVRRGAVMTGVGLAIGTVLALALSRTVESLLYGVEPTDPLTFTAVLVGFTAVALTATWLPSRRAARVDPVRVLKAE